MDVRLLVRLAALAIFVALPSLAVTSPLFFHPD